MHLWQHKRETGNQETQQFHLVQRWRWDYLLKWRRRVLRWRTRYTVCSITWPNSCQTILFIWYFYHHQFLVLLIYLATAYARPQMAPQTVKAGFLNWMEHKSHCGGQHQSPVNIESDKAFINNFPEFTFHRYEQVFPEILENDGHTGIISFDVILN